MESPSVVVMLTSARTSATSSFEGQVSISLEFLLQRKLCVWTNGHNEFPGIANNQKLQWELKCGLTGCIIEAITLSPSWADIHAFTFSSLLTNFFMVAKTMNFYKQQGRNLISSRHKDEGQL